MAVPRALVSSITSITDKQFRADHLKLCFLWYEEVLFETIGRYDEGRFFERLLEGEQNSRKLAHALSDVIIPLDKRVGKDITVDVLSRAGHGYPRWGEKYENYTYPEPENGEQFAHNSLLQHIAREHGVQRFEDGYDIEQAEGRARVATDAVLLWERVNNELPCMLQTNGDEKLAMLSAQEFSSGGTVSATPACLFNAEVPSLEKVSWKHVVDFRRNGHIKSLRDKIGQCFEYANCDIDQARALFSKAESEAIEAIVEGEKPHTRRVAIESILANIPGLPINPFSLFFGLRDTAKSFKKSKEHGWLYLLRDIRGATSALP